MLISTESRTPRPTRLELLYARANELQRELRLTTESLTPTQRKELQDRLKHVRRLIRNKSK